MVDKEGAQNSDGHIYPEFLDYSLLILFGFLWFIIGFYLFGLQKQSQKSQHIINSLFPSQKKSGCPIFNENKYVGERLLSIQDVSLLCLS